MGGWSSISKRWPHAKAQRRQAILIMNENEIAREIVDAAYQIHGKLGPGLLESVYETVLAFDLEKED